MDKPDSDFLTCDEVATALRVGIDRVWADIRAGDLKAFRIGRNYRILRSDFDEYLTRKATKTKTEE